MTNTKPAATETTTLIARFAGDTGRKLSPGQRRDLVSRGLVYTTPGPRGTDYILTDAGRAILKSWRLARKADVYCDRPSGRKCACPRCVAANRGA